MTEIDPADLGCIRDPGTEWHPKAEKWDGETLPDLTAEDVNAHLVKPETYPDSGKVMAAEDSHETPDGVM